jgi:nitroimidazol reductase NimA-like FMN-containing flavoprotein (pyridoxamine 5'-phosphate oxidase superfamily)
LTLASVGWPGSTKDMGLSDEGLEILREEECRQLLATARVGRLAFCKGAVPVVLPVTFATVGGDIMFFTGTGMKLDAAQDTRAVSFEVDEIDAIAEQGWSVLVVGRARLASQASKARAIALGLYPWASGDRQQLVQIGPSFISGRRILHA